MLPSELEDEAALRHYIPFHDYVEQLEQAEGPLVAFDIIAERLGDEPAIGLSTEGIIRRFIASVRLGGFPTPNTYFTERLAVPDLFDIGNFDPYALRPGEVYPLHPDVSTVAKTPLAMEATRSTWARWIAAQGWPVPPELLPIVEQPAVQPRRFVRGPLAGRWKLVKWVLQEKKRGRPPKPWDPADLKACHLALKDTSITRRLLITVCERHGIIRKRGRPAGN